MGGGGLLRDGRLILEGALLIPSETHYRYQRRGRNRHGYAYKLPLLDQVNGCLIRRIKWKST